MVAPTAPAFGDVRDSGGATRLDSVGLRRRAVAQQDPPVPPLHVIAPLVEHGAKQPLPPPRRRAPRWPTARLRLDGH